VKVQLTRRLVGGALAAAALLGLGLYGTARYAGNRPDPSCTVSAAALSRLGPLARGEVAAFQVAGRAAPAPALRFNAPDGARLALSDFRGKAVLLNLWATWCEPCKREMPALDRLQAEFGGPGFEVVAVNIDTRDLDRPGAWLQQAGITSLARYADPEAKIFQELRAAGLAEGLPTTLLLGSDGCLLGRLSGWAEWASAEGRALVSAARP
jgi:thiol-disulfide isomerase/thioredoxin